MAVVIKVVVVSSTSVVVVVSNISDCGNNDGSVSDSDNSSGNK